MSGSTPSAGAGAAWSAARGRFEVTHGRAGLVIGAPHGSSDGATDAIGHALARASGWGAVVATGFGGHVAGERRLNVNRPTESVPGTPAALEDETVLAREAYQTYLGHVLACADGPVVLYVEVHGNSRRENAGRIEVATVGVEIDDARRLKRLLEGVRDDRLRVHDDIPRLEILVEGYDPIHYRASAAKGRGLLGAVKRGLHLELPRAARREHPAAYSAVLADFLDQVPRVFEA